MRYSELDRKTAKIFLTYFLEGRKVASFNKMLTSLSNFNRFLLSINAIDQMVFIHKRDQIKDLNKNVVEVFTPEEQAVIEQVLKENLLPQRIDLAIAILYYTGIRVTELVTIKLENINRVKKELTVMGKGKKQRVVPLKDLVIQKMDKYIKGEREGSKHRRSPYLIVSQRSDKMSREVMTRKLKVLNNYIDCRVYAHKFRHNLATELVKKGVRINVVAEILGHSNIQTTIDYYVNTSVKDKRQAINLI
jgi:site-specific recombinase XerD